MTERHQLVAYLATLAIVIVALLIAAWKPEVIGKMAAFGLGTITGGLIGVLPIPSVRAPVATTDKGDVNAGSSCNYRNRNAPRCIGNMVARRHRLPCRHRPDAAARLLQGPGGSGCLKRRGPRHRQHRSRPAQCGRQQDRRAGTPRGRRPEQRPQERFARCSRTSAGT
jgi:hypothetical protein